MAASPERYDRDPLHPNMSVLGSTTTTQGEQITGHPETSETVVATTFTVSDPLRQPFHPQVAARRAEARALGMRLLKAPRLGGANINDPGGTIFAVEADEVALDRRLRLYQQVLRELDKCGSASC